MPLHSTHQFAESSSMRWELPAVKPLARRSELFEKVASALSSLPVLTHVHPRHAIVI